MSIRYFHSARPSATIELHPSVTVRFQDLEWENYGAVVTIDLGFRGKYERRVNHLLNKDTFNALFAYPETVYSLAKTLVAESVQLFCAFPLTFAENPDLKPTYSVVFGGRHQDSIRSVDQNTFLREAGIQIK